MAISLLIDDKMVVRRVVIPKEHVVYVRGVLEASDGVGFVFSLKGGDLTIATCPSQALELDRVLADLAAELGDQWLTASNEP